MKPVAYKRRRFPPDVIRHAVWLYLRFTLSLRDVEELLAQRGIEVSYETIRCWTRKFGRSMPGISGAAAANRPGATSLDVFYLTASPQLLSDNGSSYVTGEPAKRLDECRMKHVRAAPCHPQTHGRIERWHQTLKNRILFEHY
jgi:transposase InsO family protein